MLSWSKCKCSTDPAAESGNGADHGTTGSDDNSDESPASLGPATSPTCWTIGPAVLGSALLLAAPPVEARDEGPPIANEVVEPEVAGSDNDDPEYGWRQTWAGADVTKDVWLLYSGVTMAPFSPHIHSNGLRLRFAGGYGQYKVPVQPGAGPDAGNTVRATATHSYAEALIGYQHQFGDLTAKVLAGFATITHAPDAYDANLSISGRETGPKGVIELWLNLGPSAWTSLDAAYTTAHKTASARWRSGWRALPNLSIGPEIRYDDNAIPADSGARFGAFARYEWDTGEISVAAGVARTMAGLDDNLMHGWDVEPYATVNVLFSY